jgi:catechol 2,3-dioxygenase-like lactoylglutathione lyase family enzyme
MLVSGINHVAVLTADTDRLVEFYGSMFGAEVFAQQATPEGWTLTIVRGSGPS